MTPNSKSIHVFSVIVLQLVFQVSCRDKPQKGPGNAAEVSKPNEPKSHPTKKESAKKSIPPEEWTVVERVQFDWNGEGEPFELTAEHTSEQEGGGEFTRVRFRKKGELVYSFEDSEGLTYFSFSIGSEVAERSKHNLLDSKYFLALHEVQNPLGKPLLFLFGWPYGSSPGNLHIFELKDNGIPNLLISLKFLNLVNFINQDKSIVVRSTGEIFGPCFETYIPYIVYSWGANPMAGLKVDEKQCKAYNKAHYYGWVGMPAGDEFVVVRRPPQGGRPIILPRKKAEALFPND